ncbi:MAG TPA: hypothetical protein PLA46_14135 [Phycicoccus sp.]|nr:hypothetical protein [Phycicoccus sp.]HQY97668.1 hypothetical protein [Phycicoccus sp.]HRA44755.1 hypothetical protein [Phycicoccus sp.]
MPSADSQPARTAAWGDWCAALAPRIQALADQEELKVTGPDSAARPCKPRVSLGKRIMGQRYVNSPPWVSIKREDQLTRLTTVANDREIGFPLSKDEESALSSMTWRPASWSDGSGRQRWIPDDVPSGPYLPAADALHIGEAIARVMGDVFGITDPDDLTVA